MREQISLLDSLMDVMVKMSEGVPGAISVLLSIMKEQPETGFINILSLDDMNIRGTQIWIGFKDHCGEDIIRFLDCIKHRSPEMVATINNEGLRGNHKEKAVTSGASRPGKREFL